MKGFQINCDVPVVLLHGGLGSLAIMRSLGSLGVKVICIADDPKEYSFKSKYCTRSYVTDLHPEDPAELLDLLATVADDLEARPLVIATSDELAIFVAQHAEEISRRYLIAQATGDLVENLANKKSMFQLALDNDIPVPNMLLPQSRDDLEDWAGKIQFPVMLKGIMGNRLQERTGTKMVIVSSLEELYTQYDLLEDPDDPNLMIQELIPGGDDQVYIFNGYFNADSDCLAAFTGRKIRQFPVHTGCASLGECCWEPNLAELTTGFMKRIGYRGILDIGYRKDPRDGLYKVLDINPRVGQAFRLFLATNQIDVVRAQYLDITGQTIPSDTVPIEGRRWMIEDYDIVSSVDYWREDSLTFVDWVKSFRHLQEGAWFSWRDPKPFFVMLGMFLRKLGAWFGKKIRPGKRGAD